MTQRYILPVVLQLHMVRFRILSSASALVTYTIVATVGRRVAGLRDLARTRYSPFAQNWSNYHDATD